jgi:thiamine pyrophosphokinase
VVFNGEAVPEDAALLRTADLLVAADGGANWIDRLGIRPNLVVGDFDSIDPNLLQELQEDGVAIERHPTEKDATDGELALTAAIRAGATAITIVGALGGRTDHALTNLFLLADPALDGIEADVRRGPTTVRLVRPGATVEGTGHPGDLVSLVPVPEAQGVRTSGQR